MLSLIFADYVSNNKLIKKKHYTYNKECRESCVEGSSQWNLYALRVLSLIFADYVSTKKLVKKKHYTYNIECRESCVEGQANETCRK